MLPLSSSRNGRLRRASLLLLAAVLLYVIPTSASLPAGGKCPLHIDCAKEGRHFCRPGSSHCGPCLSPLEENKEGRCVVRKRHLQRGKTTLYPDLDEEIDYLHAYIEKQEVTEIKQPKKQSKHPAAVNSQTDVKKSETDASKHKQKNKAHPSAETLHATTIAPHAAVSALAKTSTPQPRATGVEGRAGPLVAPVRRNDNIIVIIVSVCVVLGTAAVVLATVCYIRLQRKMHLAQKIDYPAYGGTGVPATTANGAPAEMGDKTLAQSAQMYHYQHQKQQMLSMGNHKPEQQAVDTEVTSDEEEVGGDFTVYECPGLAPTGEMEVKNPLFDDSTIHYQGNQK